MHRLQDPVCEAKLVMSALMTRSTLSIERDISRCLSTIFYEKSVLALISFHFCISLISSSMTRYVQL